MNEMYWITRCDGLLAVVIIPTVILLVAAFVHFCLSCDGSFEDNERKVFRKRTVVFGGIGMFLFLVQAFIPTTNQAIIIYGVGGTIDYIKSNDTAKQLPDKVIIALDKYLESINVDKEEQHGNK